VAKAAKPCMSGLLWYADYFHGVLSSTDHGGIHIRLHTVEAGILDRLPLLQAS
jgi:hypothetical protein